MSVFEQAFVANPVGVILSIGVCIFLFFIGLSILYNGWPKFGRK